MATEHGAHDSAGRVVELPSDRPRVDPTAWVARGATVVGNVRLGPEVGVYYGAVLRAEGASITVGAQSNVQDNCVLHAGLTYSVSVGERVTIGHSAIVHGCTIDDEVLIGMGAILLNECRIGAGSIVGAGALVPEGAVIEPGSLVVGSPARVVRRVTHEERRQIVDGARHYVGLLDEHRRGLDHNAHG